MKTKPQHKCKSNRTHTCN